jgi:SAM-dependent methyltransferase
MTRDHGLPRSIAWVLAAGELAGKLSNALLHLAAGTLRQAQLNAMAAQAWRAFYTDDESVQSGFMPWERELYDSATRPGDRILIIGCGAGRDLLPFVDRGHQVVGIDPSPDPVARLRQRVAARDSRPEIIQGFIEEVPLPGRFDVVIFSWICYSYIRQSSRRIAVLGKIARHLQPGGRIVITYIAIDGARQSRAIRLTQWMARLTGSDWTPEENDVMRSERNAAGDRILTLEHWFTPESIEAEAQAAGLRVVSRKGPVGVPTVVLTI